MFHVGAWRYAVADQHARLADLLKNKSRPEAAAEGAAAWVITERALREKLKKEREAKEREQEKEVRPANDLSRCGVLTCVYV
jgi:chaperone BCS1